MEGAEQGRRRRPCCDYMRNQFFLRLEARGDTARFYQNVPMAGWELSGDEIPVQQAGGKSFEAKNLTDFVDHREPDGKRRTSMRQSVFCRFWNQSAGVRLGRLQDGGPARQGSVALVNEPSPTDPDFFKGRRDVLRPVDVQVRGDRPARSRGPLIIHRTDWRVMDGR